MGLSKYFPKVSVHLIFRDPVLSQTYVWHTCEQVDLPTESNHFNDGGVNVEIDIQDFGKGSKRFFHDYGPI